MTLRSFIVFLVVTAITATAAIYSVVRDDGPRAIATGTQPVFPDLVRNINNATEISIKDATVDYVIRKEGDRWVFVSRADYPVPFEKVKTALVALADLKLLEAKTRNPERYERLHVDDFTKDKNSKARLVTVKGEGGKILASAYLGKLNFDLYGRQGGGTYLRRADEEQSWLAEGKAEISTVAYDWIDRSFIDLKEDNVAHVEIDNPDGAKVVLHKPAATAKDFTLANLPKDREVKSAFDVNQLGRAMAGLKVEDVKKADEVDFSKDVSEARFTTFDGLTVRARVVHSNYEYWATFEASAEPAAEPAKEQPVVDSAKDAAAKPAASPAERAAAINATAKGWAYRLPSATGEALSRKLADLTQEPQKKSS